MENLTAIIVAEPKQYYVIEVGGYIEPTSDKEAVLTVVDDTGRMHARSIFNGNSGMFNAFMSMMTTNLSGTVVFRVTLEDANWILDTIIEPKLYVRRVQ